MALLVLFVGWAILGGLWALCRLAELSECRSVDAFQNSRSVLSAVAGRASPEAPVAAVTPEAHVRVLDHAPPRPRARAEAPTRRRGRTTGPANRRSAAPRRTDRAVAGVGAGATLGAVEPPPPVALTPAAKSGPDGPVVIRFYDDRADPPSTEVDTDHPASRRARRRDHRLAGQAAPVVATVAVLALIPAALALFGGRIIPDSEVEPAPDLDVSEPETELDDVVLASPEPRSVLVPEPAGDGALVVPALGERSMLEMTAREDVWLDLRAGGPGGDVIWTGMLHAGNALDRSVDAPVHLRIGNPGGLELRVDGREVTLDGSSPVNLVVTPGPDRAAATAS